jgi:hypothetical protein
VFSSVHPHSNRGGCGSGVFHALMMEVPLLTSLPSGVKHALSPQPLPQPQPHRRCPSSLQRWQPCKRTGIPSNTQPGSMGPWWGI